MRADEAALGVCYEDIDNYLEGHAIAEKAAEKIEDWYKKTRHKRHQPITPLDTWWK